MKLVKRHITLDPLDISTKRTVHTNPLRHPQAVIADDHGQALGTPQSIVQSWAGFHPRSCPSRAPPRESCA